MRYRQVDTQDPPEGIIGSQSDVTGGVGEIRFLVDLNRFADSDRVPDSALGAAWGDKLHREGGRWLCGLCGYDRAVYQSHTEVDSHTVECRNCGAVLVGWGSEL